VAPAKVAHQLVVSPAAGTRLGKRAANPPSRKPPRLAAPHGSSPPRRPISNASSKLSRTNTTWPPAADHRARGPNHPKPLRRPIIILTMSVACEADCLGLSAPGPPRHPARPESRPALETSHLATP